MSRRTYVDNASNRSLGRVGMAHGTAVHSASSSSSYSGGGSSSYSRSTVSPQRIYVDNSANRSIGRVGKEVGTHVVHKDGSLSSATGSGASSSPRTYVDNSANQRLGRVGKEVGSHVVHNDGSVTLSAASASASASSSSVYADNWLNRKYGRVGKPAGTHVVHKDGSATISTGATSSVPTVRYYVDNAYNRKLERVGQEIKSRKVNSKRVQREIVNESTLEELLAMLQELNFKDPYYPAIVDAQYQLQRNRVEEKWMESGIQPLTDHSQVAEYAKEKIPLEDIEIKDQIGEGSFGKVFAGLWKKKTPIAFKKLIYQQITKKKLDQLQKEIRIFSSLNHDNVVKMFGVVLERNNIGIVMEYLPKTLFHAIFIEEVEFSAADKHRISMEVISALEYLHVPSKSQEDRAPIAHCDVKTQNILLDASNVAKLCDFGLSAMKNSAESSSSHYPAAPGQGTPRYAAPEVLRGELLNMESLMMSDIYSLSLVVYELLVEEEVYEDLGFSQLVENVGRGSLRPSLDRGSLSEPVKKLLSEGWDKTSGNRPDIGQFSKQLAQYSLYI